MTPADPTYPLFPIACIISAAGLLLVFLTSFVRQSWNLGVAFLCFWLFWENLSSAINAIVWADNAEVRLYVYCDIGEHMFRLCVYEFDLHDSLAYATHYGCREAYGDSDHNSSTVSDC